MLLREKNNKSLIETRLQFLEPPEGQATLIAQAISVLDLQDGDDAPDSPEPRKRRNYLKRPEVSKALEAALANPDILDLQQLKLVYRAVACAAPIPFSPPFLKYSSTPSGRFNSRHAFGKTLLRCLVACCIAERDERLPKAVLKNITEVRSGYSFSQRIKAQDVSFYERLGIFWVDSGEFATRLFGIIKDNKLIDGFVPPSVPDDSETVPEIRFANKSNAASRQKSEIIGTSRFGAAFGKLITDWPLPDRGTRPKDTKEDMC